MHLYGTNPLSTDSDNDGINDALDPDTTTPFEGEVCVLYDDNLPGLSALKTVFSQHPNLIFGTLEDIPDYQDMDYLILLGYPGAGEGTVGHITYSLLSEEEREQMLQSPRYRFAVKVNPWPGTKLVIMLSQPYHGDRWRIFAMLKDLKVELVDNTAEVDFPFANTFFYLHGEQKMDTYMELYLTRALAPRVWLTRYNFDTTPHHLDQSSGLAPGELPVGKFMDFRLSGDVQGNPGDDLDHALFRIYYTALDLDRTPGKDGDCTDPGDINENTLCLYGWDEVQGKWTRVTTSLGWVNGTGVDTTNIQPYDKPYEGYAWADVGHFSLYALAGKPRPRPALPGPPVVVATPTATATATASPIPVATSTPTPVVTPVPTTTPETTATPSPSPAATQTPVITPAPTPTPAPEEDGAGPGVIAGAVIGTLLMAALAFILLRRRRETEA